MSERNFKVGDYLLPNDFYFLPVGTIIGSDGGTIRFEKLANDRLKRLGDGTTYDIVQFRYSKIIIQLPEEPDNFRIEDEFEWE